MSLHCRFLTALFGKPRVCGTIVYNAVVWFVRQLAMYRSLINVAGLNASLFFYPGEQSRLFVTVSFFTETDGIGSTLHCLDITIIHIGSHTQHKHSNMLPEKRPIQDKIYILYEIRCEGEPQNGVNTNTDT